MVLSFVIMKWKTDSAHSDHAHTLAYAALLYILAENAQPMFKKLKLLRKLFKTELLDLAVLAPLTAIATIGGWTLYGSRYFVESGDDVLAGGAVWADGPIHLHTAESFLQGINKDVSFFKMQSPIAAGHTMVYPYLPDFLTAFLHQQGDPYRIAMGLTGCILAISYTALQYLFGRRITQSRPAALLAVVLITCSGGYGGWDMLRSIGWEQMKSYDPVQDSTSERGTVFWFGFYPHVMLPQRGATFGYPLVLVIFLMIWCITGKDNISAAGCDVVPDIPDSNSRNDSSAHQSQGSLFGPSRFPMQGSQEATLLVAAAAIAGLLPMIQAHAFVAVALVLVTVFALHSYRWLDDMTVLPRWGGAGAVAVVVALPMLLMINSKVSGDGQGFFDLIPVFTTSPGWPGQGSSWAKLSHFCWFWWKALGPTVFLYFLVCVIVAVRQQLTLLAWVASSAAVFAMANMVRFQPWDKDNIKLFYIWLFIAAPLIAELLVMPFELLARAVFGASEPSEEVVPSLTDDVTRLMRVLTGQSDDDDKRRAARKAKAARGGGMASKSASSPSIGGLGVMVAGVLAIVASLTVVYMTFSGGAGIVREMRMQHQLYGLRETQVANFVTKHTPHDAVWLVQDNHRALTGMLNGRSQFVSYSGWMWSHGYDWNPQREARDIILRDLLTDSNRNVYQMLKHNKIRYILADHMPVKASPKPNHGHRSDFLDGKVVRVYDDHEQYCVYEVL